MEHELWAAAQLAPGEGIEDGVARISAILSAPHESADTLSMMTMGGAAQLREELDVAGKLLAERTRLLQSIPGCEHHGDQCVPHAMAWVQDSIQARAEIAALRRDAERWRWLRQQQGWPDSEAAMLQATPEQFDASADAAAAVVSA